MSKIKNKIELSEWIKIHGYCATRIIKGSNRYNVKNRVAFIEKSPRVRIAPFTDLNSDFKNWEFGEKGSEYGADEDSRKWCDERLTELGYKLN